MKLLIQTIVMIIGGYYLFDIMKDDTGYVLLSYNSVTVETSMVIFAVGTLITLIASYFLFRLLGAIVFAPSRIGKWQTQRRDRVAVHALSRGLIAQAEGKWRQSEKALLTYAKKTDSAINYLAAAKSAQAQGSIDRMNQYLDLAQATDPGSSSAIRLTQAELLIDSGQFDRAAAALERIRQEDPKNARALLLMTKLFKESNNWGKLSELLYHIKRNKVLQIDAFNQLEKVVYYELLKQSCESDSLIEARNTWSIIPKYLQKDNEIIAVYSRKLIIEGEQEKAEPYIRNGLRQHWSDELVYLYGLLYTSNPYNELSVAEKWYKQYPNNATLLLSLGRLSSRSELWGKAKSYLETSVENGGGPESYHALAQVLEHIDEPEMAADMYRKGLEIASGKGLPELAALTAKKKSAASANAKQDADLDLASEQNNNVLETSNKEEKITASAA